MNLTHLRYMVEVERQGSITKAAAALYMGQPNLSKAIKEMELEFGIPIFRRSAKGVVPTEKGQEFLRYAKAIIVQMDNMEELYKENGDSRTEMRIILPRAGYVTCAFTEFAKKLPQNENIDIRMREADTLEALNAIVECEYSLAVISFELSREELAMSLVSEKNLRSQELATFDKVILMSKNSPLARHDTLSAEQLADGVELVCGGNELPFISSALQKRPAKSGENSRRICVSEHSSRFGLLAAMPNGYMLSPPMPEAFLKSCGLVRRKPAEKHSCREMLICQNSYRQNAADRLFLGELKQMIAVMKEEEKNRGL